MIEQVEKLEDVTMPSHGQTVWCSSEDKCYRYDAIEGWQEVPEDNETTIGMNMYDINKQIISQLSGLTDNQLEIKKAEINSLHDIFHNHFYMLYGKEISYFTVFKIKEQIAFGREVIDVIKNVGAVKAIDPTENADAMEVWVIYDDEPTCLYLFPYDSGIVQVGE